MTHLPRRVRGLLIAVAILALSAGAAAAARPTFSTPDAATGGLDRAREASGVGVPVAGAPSVDAPAIEEAPSTEPSEAPSTEPSEAPADAGTTEAAAEHPDNHGADVMEAAKGDTPGEFDNHGQYVKSIATDNHGQATERTTGTDRAEQVKPSR